MSCFQLYLCYVQCSRCFSFSYLPFCCRNLSWYKNGSGRSEQLLESHRQLGSELGDQREETQSEEEKGPGHLSWSAHWYLAGEGGSGYVTVAVYSEKRDRHRRIRKTPPVLFVLISLFSSAADYGTDPAGSGQQSKEQPYLFARILSNLPSIEQQM